MPENNEEELKNRRAMPPRNDFLNAVHNMFNNFVKNDKVADGKKKIIDKWALKVQALFITPPKEDNKLSGRIRELDANAKDVLKVLSTVREDLKKEVDGELYSYVESVMAPMIRDVERVKNIVKNDGAIHTQVGAFNKYNQWIDKAKLFVHVCNTAKNKDEISKVVVQHTIDDFIAIIDRDLQLVEDYQGHLFTELQVTKEERKDLKKELDEDLEYHIESLMELKNYPKKLDLENLNVWRIGADQARDFHFNTILQIIDLKLEVLNPSQSQEHHMLAGNLEQIAYLEMEIPALIEKFQQTGDSFEQKVSFQQLINLEHEVEDLYHDISLPQGMVDRLTHVKEILDKAFLKIKPKN